MVGPFDVHTAQQVGIDLVAGGGSTEPRLRIECLDARDAHQALRSFAIDAEFDRHAPAAEERQLHVQLIEAPQKSEILRAFRLRLMVIAGTGDPEQRALIANAEPRVFRIDPTAFFLSRACQLFF
jgi:hypothetical protein